MQVYSGGTLEASFWRIIGTLVGAFTGWAALAAGDNSPYLLALFAVLLGKLKKYSKLTLFIKFFLKLYHFSIFI